MSRSPYIRTLVAGRFMKAVQYDRPLPGDGKITRAHKSQATAKAQQYINIKNSTERLELLLCGNFDSKQACFCTFTFSNDQLPTDRKGVKKIASEYMRKLRDDFRRRDRELKYIYTIEGEPLSEAPDALHAGGQKWEIAPWSDKERWESLSLPEPPESSEKAIRFHIHCFLLLDKSDYDTVRALWPFGHVYINRMNTRDSYTFSRLASYVTKERRSGKRSTGERTYTPSKNLAQPVITGHWCEPFEVLEAPDGAEEVYSGRDDTPFACFRWLKCRLKKPQQEPKETKSRGSLRPKKPRKRAE